MGRGAVVVGVGVALVVTSAGKWGVGAQAKEEPKRNRACNVATIRGTYGIQITGTRPAPNGQIESVIGVAIRHYDGQGHFEQVGNVKGSISGFSPDQPGDGTYQVNEDCSGVAEAQVSPTVLLEDRFAIVDDGNEIRSMVSAPAPVMVTGVYKRTNTR
jgi:hypothetical protein